MNLVPWPPADLSDEIIDAGIVSLESGESEVLVRGEATSPHYVASGHLVFGRANSIWAAAFDTASGSITSGPMPVVSNVASGFDAFDVAHDGTLVYVSESSAAEGLRELVRVDSNGREERLAAPPRAYGIPRVSPTGDRIAVGIDGEIWIYDRALEPLTRGPGGKHSPIWSPDGERIAYYASGREGGPGIFARRADGTGAVERITTDPLQYPQAWSPDGNHVVFHDVSDTDLYTVDLEDADKPRQIGAPDVRKLGAAISPDGRWVAFGSERAGSLDVWVQPFPDGGRQHRISTSGGRSPVWADDGSRLFFRAGPDGSALMSVEIGNAAPETWVAPETVMPWPYVTGLGTHYDVAADGRFLALKPTANDDREAAPRIVLVQSWAEELERLVPTN